MPEQDVVDVLIKIGATGEAQADAAAASVTRVGRAARDAGVATTEAGAALPKFYEGVEQAGIAATGSERGMRRMEYALGGLSATALGAQSEIGSLAEGVLLFTGGSAMVIGALGGLAALGGAVKLLSDEMDAADTAAEKMGEAFEKAAARGHAIVTTTADLVQTYTQIQQVQERSGIDFGLGGAIQAAFTTLGMSGVGDFLAGPLEYAGIVNQSAATSGQLTGMALTNERHAQAAQSIARVYASEIDDALLDLSSAPGQAVTGRIRALFEDGLRSLKASGAGDDVVDALATRLGQKAAEAIVTAFGASLDTLTSEYQTTLPSTNLADYGRPAFGHGYGRPGLLPTPHALPTNFDIGMTQFTPEAFARYGVAGIGRGADQRERDAEQRQQEQAGKHADQFAKLGDQFAEAMVSAVGRAITMLHHGGVAGVLGAGGDVLGALASRRDDKGNLVSPGLGLPATLLSVASGLVSLFSGSHGTPRITIHNYDEQALSQIRATLPQSGLVSVAVFQGAGMSPADLQYTLNRLSRRDAITRLPTTQPRPGQ